MFDLGGVVLDIDWNRVYLKWARYSRLSFTQIADRFQIDAAYQDHERGRISGTEYFTHLRELMEYEGDEASFVLGWNAIFVGPINETVNILGLLDPGLPIYLLTNTNKTHETKWRTTYSEVVGLFNNVFVSSTIGYRKPERQAFEHALKVMDVDADAVLFFDDTEENIVGAKAVGLQTVHVAHSSSIRKALIDFGALK